MNTVKKAFLLLADGTVFSGKSLGAEGKSTGEIVFNTGMTGYQEVLTDPSYFGQSVCMTYPLIGNYGLNKEDYESRKTWVTGLIVRKSARFPSNWRAYTTVDAYLKKNNVVGIEDIDTRQLTRKLRDNGVMNGIIYSEGNEPTETDIAAMKAYVVKDAVKSVTGDKEEVFLADDVEKYKVALLDFGSKYNIERELKARGCTVTIVPAYTKPEDILNRGFHGVMLSNGPGDPAENVEIIENLKVLTHSGIPVFGICLGHQLLALSLGAQTTKLRYGHRGANHPVKHLSQDRTYITSQNHGYAVVGESLDTNTAKISHVNLNDNTVEGIEYLTVPVFSVQYHPEACPGPMDSTYLFDKFLSLMDTYKGGSK